MEILIWRYANVVVCVCSIANMTKNEEGKKKRETERESEKMAPRLYFRHVKYIHQLCYNPKRVMASFATLLHFSRFRRYKLTDSPCHHHPDRCSWSYTLPSGKPQRLPPKYALRQCRLHRPWFVPICGRLCLMWSEKPLSPPSPAQSWRACTIFHHHPEFSRVNSFTSSNSFNVINYKRSLPFLTHTTIYSETESKTQRPFSSRLYFLLIKHLEVEANKYVYK